MSDIYKGDALRPHRRGLNASSGLSHDLVGHVFSVFKGFYA